MPVEALYGITTQTQANGIKAESIGNRSGPLRFCFKCYYYNYFLFYFFVFLFFSVDVDMSVKLFGNYAQIPLLQHLDGSPLKRLVKLFVSIYLSTKK